jgi:hypothetical protein
MIVIMMETLLSGGPRKVVHTWFIVASWFKFDLTFRSFKLKHFTASSSSSCSQFILSTSQWKTILLPARHQPEVPHYGSDHRDELNGQRKVRNLNPIAVPGPWFRETSEVRWSMSVTVRVYIRVRFSLPRRLSLRIWIYSDCWTAEITKLSWCFNFLQVAFTA